VNADDLIVLVVTRQALGDHCTPRGVEGLFGKIRKPRPKSRCKFY